jgi:DNA invertase Pin-like site-specific DNA recombinase
MLHIYAALAEKERAMISARTKDALRAAKARGVKLGNQAQSDANRATADASAEALRSIVWPVINLPSRQIAAILNGHAIKTPTGKAWQSMTVLRLIERLKENRP